MFSCLHWESVVHTFFQLTILILVFVIVWFGLLFFFFLHALSYVSCARINCKSDTYLWFIWINLLLCTVLCGKSLLHLLPISQITQSGYTITELLFGLKVKILVLTVEANTTHPLTHIKRIKGYGFTLPKAVCCILFHDGSEQPIVNPVTTKQTIGLRCRFSIVSIIFGDLKLCDQ